MTTRTITISSEDLAALRQIRSVVADAVGHPARDAAISAIDRVTAEPADAEQVTDHLVSPFFEVSGCADCARRQAADQRMLELVVEMTTPSADIIEQMDALRDRMNPPPLPVLGPKLSPGVYGQLTSPGGEMDIPQRHVRHQLFDACCGPAETASVESGTFVRFTAAPSARVAVASPSGLAPPHAVTGMTVALHGVLHVGGVCCQDGKCPGCGGVLHSQPVLSPARGHGPAQIVDTDDACERCCASRFR